MRLKNTEKQVFGVSRFPRESVPTLPKSFWCFSTNLVLKRTGPAQSIPPRISNLGMAEVENLTKMTIFPCFSALFQIYQTDTSKFGLGRTRNRSAHTHTSIDISISECHDKFSREAGRFSVRLQSSIERGGPRSRFLWSGTWLFVVIGDFEVF